MKNANASNFPFKWLARFYIVLNCAFPGLSRVVRFPWELNLLLDSSLIFFSSIFICIEFASISRELQKQKGSEFDARLDSLKIKIHHYSNYSSDDALKMLMTTYVILDVCDYDIFMHKFKQSDKWEGEREQLNSDEE